jgi:hypothetical protein
MMEGLGHGYGGQGGGARGGEGGGHTEHDHTNTQLRKPPTMLDGEGRGPLPPRPFPMHPRGQQPTHKISVLRVCGSHVCMGEGAGAGAPQAHGW